MLESVFGNWIVYLYSLVRGEMFIVTELAFIFPSSVGAEYEHAAPTELIR
jgi:hypothetical protein